MEEKLLLGSDHAGYKMKEDLKEHLTAQGFKIEDIGTFGNEAVDYPDFGHKLGELISNGDYKTAISICGSGNGINMTTNKHKGVRGAICWNEEISELARRHNDANICSIPARYMDNKTARRVVDIFLKTGFDGGRHTSRIQKIDI